jgi:hypothetical protein
MTVEVATYINDLQAINPPSTDPTNQGDDHLRLLKQVLQNSIIGSSRQFQIPSAIAISTTTAVTKANGESTLYVSTAGGAVTLTMPALAALDAGWKVRIIKTSSDVNPIFIAPNTGTINSGGIAGLAKARRCIPGVQSTVIWDGAAWFVTRVHSLPIGSVITFHGTTLAAGFEWPNGQTLASASTNYPEYNAVEGSGLTPDYRGRASVCVDSLGGLDAGRLNVTGCSLLGVRNSIGSGGGAAASTLAVVNLPPYTPTGTVATSTSISHNAAINGGGSGTPGPFTAALNAPGGATITATSTSTYTGNAQGGTTTAFDNAQPSVMCAKLLVVE